MMELCLLLYRGNGSERLVAIISGEKFQGVLSLCFSHPLLGIFNGTPADYIFMLIFNSFSIVVSFAMTLVWEGVCPASCIFPSHPPPITLAVHSSLTCHITFW